MDETEPGTPVTEPVWKPDRITPEELLTRGMTDHLKDVIEDARIYAIRYAESRDAALMGDRGAAYRIAVALDGLLTSMPEVFSTAPDLSDDNAESWSRHE